MRHREKRSQAGVPVPQSQKQIAMNATDKVIPLGGGMGTRHWNEGKWKVVSVLLLKYAFQVVTFAVSA